MRSTEDEEEEKQDVGVKNESGESRDEEEEIMRPNLVPERRTNSKYIRSPIRKLADKFEYSIKIVVVGDFFVGKTAIIDRYCRNQFSESYRMTMGVDFRQKELSHLRDSAVIRMRLWDIQGQERFLSATSVFYRSALGAAVVVDATRPFTLASAVAWKEDIDRQVTLPPAYREKKLQFPVILLVNKCDLVCDITGPSTTMRAQADISSSSNHGSVEVSDSLRGDISHSAGSETSSSSTPQLEDPKEQHRVGMRREEIDEFCRKHGFISWYPTSAKFDINLNDAFESLARFAIDAHPDSDAVENHRTFVNLRRSSDSSTSNTSSSSTRPCSC